MKLSGWMVVVVLVCAGFARAGVEELRVTADFRGMPLRGALNVLEIAIPTEFGAERGWLGDPERPVVDVAIEDKPLLEAISELVAAYGFYPVNDGRFVLLKQGTAADPDEPFREADQWRGPWAPEELVAETGAWLAVKRTGDEPPRWRNLIATLEPAEAIARLALVGSPEAVAVCREVLFEPAAGSWPRKIALFALGFIGSDEAVGAIAEFERQATEGWHLLREIRPDDQHARILATSVGPDAAEWVLFERGLVPGARYWLAQSLGGGRWGPPLLVTPPLGAGEVALSWQDGTLKLDAAMTLDLERLRGDRDRDGLTDALEELLPTSWLSRDTDRDGVFDDVDSNPVTPKHEETDVTAARQAVFAAFYAIDQRGGTLHVRTDGEWAKQEFYGSGGLVVPAATPTMEGRRTLMGIGVTMIAPDAARAEIGEWVGGDAAWGFTAYLRKRFGRWVVTWAQPDWIA